MAKKRERKVEKGRIVRSGLWLNYKSYLVALSAAGALSTGAAAAVVLVPSLVSRGKNGVTSNGILSRTDVYETAAALTISTWSPHGSSLIRPPRGSAATWSSLLSSKAG